MTPLRLKGLVVATVLPFTRTGEIDWASNERLLEFCAAPRGVDAVFVNGHAGEGAALTRDERRAVIVAARSRLGRTKPLLAGIISFSTADAIAETEAAMAAGADGAVLFPPPAFAAGGARTPAAPVAFVEAVAKATGAPLSIFQQPLASGLGFTTETLVRIAEIPNVVAVKEGSDTMTAYEDNWRALKASAPRVAVLASNFDWFAAQMAVGADGVLSGLASLAPRLLAELWHAAEAKDLPRLRAAGDRLHPLVRSIYGPPPRMDMHTRIKAALTHLGIIDCAAPRPPLLPLDPATERAVAAMVDAAGLAASERDWS